MPPARTLPDSPAPANSLANQLAIQSVANRIVDMKLRMKPPLADLQGGLVDP
jgi:hypothetical protein